jgi:(S)-ureidoglycine aminohydrolase
MLDTRTRYARDHSLLTPDTFVRAALPGMKNAVAIVHAAPAHGAGFAEYTVEFDPGGSFETGANQTFVYVLAGTIRVGAHSLVPGQYAYVPPGAGITIEAKHTGRAVFIEKPYFEIPGVAAPEFFVGNEHAVDPVPMMGDETVAIRVLIPGDFKFDFAVNIMTFEPGAQLPMVEAHVMEHGLLMLEGGGIYRLGENWYPVSAGDFIWMAPYCPQWFGALGKTPAKYLIYKDWNRHPLQAK